MKNTLKTNTGVKDELFILVRAYPRIHGVEQTRQN